ncbi:MAG: farnesyl diphosphate synthase [Burkholderiaceae bacterium]
MKSASAVAAAATPDFAAWCRDTAAGIELALSESLPGADVVPARLHEAMRYASLGGGKRVRPLLVHASAGVSGASQRSTMAAACAVELIHAYSLVHDDLPCMDDDDVRRGRPTVHVAFDEALAMLVGDGLQALAFGLLGEAGLAEPELPTAALVAELATAAGSGGMVGGQAIDIESVGRRLERDALERMHRRKTGALLRASVRLGWMAGPAAASDAAGGRALDAYADAIGLAFQVIDDVLDVEGDSATLGKTAGKDSEAGKPTYVSIMGLDEARSLALALRDEAHRALERFGDRAERLAQLADLIVLRKS